MVSLPVTTSAVFPTVFPTVLRMERRITSLRDVSQRHVRWKQIGLQSYKQYIYLAISNVQKTLCRPKNSHRKETKQCGQGLTLNSSQYWSQDTLVN